MKILHTSDWHLGQSFMGQSRAEEHRKLIDWVTTVVSDQNIDAVILAGDVFDTSTPPSYARELYLELVLNLFKQDCTLIVVAGNHDSVSVLNESKELLAHIETHVITQPSWDALEESIIPLKDSENQVRAVVCAVPFLRARDMVNREAGQSMEAKQSQLAERITEYYGKLFDHAKRQAGELPVIGTGHLTVLGGQKTESVRDIYVGSLEALAPALLPDFDYLALGHIHKPMQVGGKKHWRYSGSPLPMSFDESGSAKSVAIYDTQARDVSILAIPSFRKLKSLSGTRKELLQQITDIEPSQDLNSWLDLTLTEDANIGSFQEQVSEILQDKPIEVLKVQRTRQHINLASPNGETATLEDVTPQEVFVQLLQEKGVEEDRAKSLEVLFNNFVHQDPEASS